MKAVKLTRSQWEDILSQIKKDYPKSVWMVRSRMKTVLGFTTREHREWREDYVSMVPNTMMHLDFFDESKRTMFLLKYSDFMQSNK